MRMFAAITAIVTITIVWGVPVVLLMMAGWLLLLAMANVAGEVDR